MKKLFSMMLVMALAMCTFTSCSEDDEESKFKYPMETLYGTWEATHIRFSGSASWSDLSYWGSKYQFSATFYSSGRYYGRGYFGTGEGTYTASGNTVVTYVDGEEYYIYDILSLSNSSAHVSMGLRGGDKLEVKLKKR